MIKQARDNLVRLTVAIEAGEPVPADVADWLMAGVREFNTQGGVRPLCVCLRLRARGQPSAGTLAATEERNQWIAKAFKLVSLDKGLSDWERAKRLAQEIQTFEQRAWPRLRSNNEPPTDNLRHCLYMAFKTGRPIPRGARTLSSIANKYPVSLAHK